MRLILAGLAVITIASITACGGGGSSVSPTPAVAASATATAVATAAATAVATSTASGTTLAAASSSTCVNAQTSAQTVTLPDTGGVTAVFSFAEYDAGGTGCQNITIATGSAISLTTVSQTARRTQASSPNPIISTTLGQGFTSTLGLTTVVSGMTLTTDPNVNLQNGTYNATITFGVAGSQLTLSLMFTATNGKLVVTGGSALPLNLGAGAQLLIYDRGVVPPGFTLATPSPVPTASPSPTPSPVVTPTAVPSVTTIVTYGPPAPPAGTTIGTQSYTTLDPCPQSGFLYSGYLCSASQPLVSNGGQPIALIGFPAPGDAGQVSYTVSAFAALNYTVIGCDPPVSYAGGGLSGTFTFPAFFNSDGSPNAAWAKNSGVCEIDLSTLPVGASGFYSDIQLDLFGGSNPGPAPTTGPYPVSTPSPTSGMAVKRSVR